MTYHFEFTSAAYAVERLSDLKAMLRSIQMIVSWGDEDWQSEMPDQVQERSFELIDTEDLHRLAELALKDLGDFYARRPITGTLYSDRLVALCLCQGAAEHFVRPGRGVKDFDVWAFYSAHPTRAFPYRRRGTVDFGASKFGRHPSFAGLVGRKVDVIGRSLVISEGQGAVEAIRGWLLDQQTESAREIGRVPVVGLFPQDLFRRVIWDPDTDQLR